jgi:hypothetical protein
MDGVLGRDRTQLTKQKQQSNSVFGDKSATIMQHLRIIYATYMQHRSSASVSVRVVCGSPESRRQLVKIKRFLCSFRFHELATGAGVCYCLTHLWFY